MVILLVGGILVTTVIAIIFTNVAGSTDDDEEPVSVLMERTGCLDMDLRPVAGDPPVSLFEVEADVRAQIDRPDEIDDVTTDDDDAFVPGDLVWADYGELIPANGAQVQRDEAWVLVFEDERHESWWDRLANRRVDARFSVVYRPESGQVVAACSGEV
jgi:hypothetical protein